MGVSGDGSRTALSFKSAVELVQVVAQVRVVDGVGGGWFVVGEQSQTLPDRHWVVICELPLESL